MSSFIRSFLQTTIITCSAVFLLNACPQDSFAQLSNDTIVFSEFFEEIFSVTPDGTVTDILNSDPSNSPFGQRVEVLDQNSIVISSFSDLYLHDVPTQTTSFLTSLSFVPSEITRDVNGGLIATSSGGVFGVDVITGTETLIFETSFFSPNDAVVSADGSIFITEFFNELGVVDRQTGTFQQIPNSTGGSLRHIDIGINGELFALVSGNDFFSIDPFTGQSTMVGSFDGSFVDDIKVDDNGQILFSGSQSGINSIYSLNPEDGSIDTVVLGSDIDTFFSVLDIAYLSSEFRDVSAVPEPSSAAILLLVTSCVCSRRNRSSARL